MKKCLKIFVILWIVPLGILINFCHLANAEEKVGIDDKKQLTSKESKGEDTDEDELTGGSQTDQVLIRGLNKVTAHISDIVATVGQKATFGSLEITARLCQKSPPEDPPESTAYLDIQEIKPGEKTSSVFSGWMFASSPAVSALEHPVYDLWVLNCQGRILQALPVADKELPLLSLEDDVVQQLESVPKTPAIDAFNRGFNHAR